MNEEAAEGNGVCGQWLGEGYGLIVPAVENPGRGTGVEGWVALRQVVAEFFKELESGGVGFRGGHAAFAFAFGDAPGFFGVEARELVVKFDPVIPLHGAETHCYVV